MEEQKEKIDISTDSMEGVLKSEGIQTSPDMSIENGAQTKEEDDENIQLAENSHLDEELTEEDKIMEVDGESLACIKKRKLLKQTKIVKQTWSIQEIYQKEKTGQLILSPDYQRKAIWNIEKRTAFIESLFMGIIIPPIYVVEIASDDDLLDGLKYEVVDGKQRLTAVTEFLKNKYPLNKKSLEYFKDWFEDRTFNDLRSERSDLVKEMLSSVLDIYVITSKSPEFTKYDIFSRLNKGAEPLRVNELRRAVYKSDLTKQIDDFLRPYLVDVESEKVKLYKKIFSPKLQSRYEDYGKFYASVAFFHYSDLEQCVVNNYNSRPREMINKALQEAQDKKYTIEQDVLNRILQATIDFREKIISVDLDVARKDYIINSCIPFVKDYNKQIYEKFLDICKDPKIQETLETSPGTTSNVNKRLQIIKNIIIGG